MNLLILESPLFILLTLAQQIGLDIAILQQQLHFRLKHQGQECDERLWCQTYTNWTKQLPFWKEYKSKSLFIKLEKDGLMKINGQVNHVFCQSYKKVFKLSTVCSIYFSMPTKIQKKQRQYTRKLCHRLLVNVRRVLMAYAQKEKTLKTFKKKEKRKMRKAHPSLFKQQVTTP